MSLRHGPAKRVCSEREGQNGPGTSFVRVDAVGPMTSAVALVPIDRENVRAVCDPTLRPGQERYVAPSATTIAEAACERDLA